MKTALFNDDTKVLTTPMQSSVNIAMFGDTDIEFVDFEGRKQMFSPDATRGFFRFEMAHGFPAGTTAYGTALHPGVTGASWPSLLYQNVNYDHQIKAYHHKPGKPTNVEDRILGSIVAASYPKAPSQGWKINPTSQVVPFISGVASFAKLATAMNKVVGDHQTGRHNYTVSMEVQYDYTKSGFIVDQATKPNSSTPDDIAKAGMEWFAWADAPAELLATFSVDKNRIIKPYQKKRTAVMMMGGINGSVHFAGMGLVKYGAEATAKITRMAASGTPALMDSIGSLPDLFRQAFSGKLDP